MSYTNQQGGKGMICILPKPSSEPASSLNVEIHGTCK